MSNADSVYLSLVVPIFNESESIPALIRRVQEALAGFSSSWELLLVDDGSVDDSVAVAVAAASSYPGSTIRVIELQRNFGQTAAMQAGIDAAAGEFIATLDGDLQNDPADIPRMLDELLRRDLDLLVGWRADRKDKLLLRKIPSWIANRLIGRITGVRLHDYGCSLKIYRASVIKQVKLLGEMHRFIPAWVAVVVPTSRIGEMAVNHHARQFGTSKYGISRSIRVVLDLLSVLFFMRFRARPGHFFGPIGLVSGVLGGLILFWLAIEKFVFGEDIGARPLLMIGVLLLLAAMQFITTGILAEMISRSYYDSDERTHYVVRKIHGPE